MTRLSRLAPAFFVLVLAGLLAACDLSDPGPGPTPGKSPTAALPVTTRAGSPQPPPTDAPPTATTPAEVPRGGTLTVRIAHDVTSLNPFFVDKGPGARDEAAGQVTGLLFSGLTRIDDHLRPVPDLAESWDVAPDGLSIVFKLRPNVKWHDGSPLTSDDVIWTYNTWLNLTGTTALKYHLHDSVIQIQKATPPESTVRFWLNKPYAPILSDLAAPILPKHLLGDVPLDQLETHPFNAKPVGSGPFRFAERKAGENVILAANPDYYGGAPHLDRVAFLVAPDPQVALKAVSEGNLALADVPQTAWEDYSRRPGIQNLYNLGQWADLSYYFLAFNTRPGHALSDLRLRQAWALALNKEALVRTATHGAGLPIWGDVHPASWANAPDSPRLNNDPARARQLLTEAGWTDTNADGIVDKGGEALKITLYVRADDAARRAAADAMRVPLAAVGISTTVAPVDFSVIGAKIDPLHEPAFDFHAMLMGWDSQSIDPDDYALFHSSQIRNAGAPNGLNYVGYSSAEYDDLSIKARGEYDPAKRAALYAQIQQLLASDMPYYPLWADSHYLMLSRRIAGPINLQSPRYLWNVEKWWMEPAPAP
ncbi:MAG TPA: ABC transporter substrate-binding protein [Chloroflexia bacterium]|nr:ABC transporter substrate-binding protein [Chloroflexia bacterium]